MKHLIYALMILASTSVEAKIKNGYKGDMEKTRKSHRDLIALKAQKGLSQQRREKINTMLATADNFIRYYEITERRLAEFRLIAPDLYNQIDTIKDANGNEVDVYVRLVNPELMLVGYHGFTNLNSLEDDRDTYISEYGAGTVSVQVADVRNVLIVLAHEFGHVHYQVPNLALYLDEYDDFYKMFTSKKDKAGHAKNDPSGEEADRFEDLFIHKLKSQ